MGQAGFEPATSQSEAGHPFWFFSLLEIKIQARLQALVLVGYTLKILDFKKMFAKRRIAITSFSDIKEMN